MTLSSADEAAFRARARAALVGAFVADAASMSLHWIYKPDALQKLVGDADPAFFDPPSCPFYKYPLGSLTPYGDEALPVLVSATHHGGINGKELTQNLAAHFKAYTGRLNSPSKALVQAVQDGKAFPDAAMADDQANCLVKVPVVVARYAGTPELKQKVLEAVRSHQKSSVAEDCALAFAAILEQVLLGSTVQAALDQAPSLIPESVQEAFKAACAPQQAGDITKTVQALGPSCHLPDSFQGPIAVVSSVETFEEAVRANIMAGGDQASRAHVVGALLAGQHGIEAVPESWRHRTTRLSEIEGLVETLLSQRPTAGGAQ